MISVLQKLKARLTMRGSASSRSSSDTSREGDRTLARSGLHSTGETVFGDRALRFRNLTLSVADDPALFDPDSTGGGFKIRLAKLETRQRDAGTLIEHRYGSVGYRIPDAKQDQNLLTFIAYDDGSLVGTVGLRLDSERGLAADELYGAEVDQLRRSGARLCEFTRLAVDRMVASKPVLAGLFHTAYLYGSRIRGCTHAVIEVTPQHSGFYRRALKFERIGAQRLNPRVNTQGVLMYVSFSTIAAALAMYAGKPEVPGALRSLFVYGFPPNEEVGVLHRLQHMAETV